MLYSMDIHELCMLSPSVMSDCSPPGSSVCGDSPGQDIGVGGHFLLQGFQGMAECKSRCWALGHWGGIEGK